jgi:hypothetical protein
LKKHVLNANRGAERVLPAGKKVTGGGLAEQRNPCRSRLFLAGEEATGRHRPIAYLNIIRAHASNHRVPILIANNYLHRLALQVGRSGNGGTFSPNR